MLYMSDDEFMKFSSTGDEAFEFGGFSFIHLKLKSPGYNIALSAYTCRASGASLVPLPYFLTGSLVARSSSLNHLTSFWLIRLATMSA